MRLALVLALGVLTLAAPAAAQRRTRTTAPAPVDAQLFALTTPHMLRLSVVARTEVELTADVRLLHLEVRAPGARRGLPCDPPVRPRRLDASTVRSMHAGETWDATFDVRNVCWGRALAALEAGAELSGSFGTARGRAGIPIATSGATSTRSVPLAPVMMAALVPPAAPAGDVRISLAPADAVTGARLALRVTIRATRPLRAWARPNRVRFRVVAPDGTARTCAISRGGSAPIADLFARVGTRSGPMFSLEARAYCGAHAFAAAGIYEVTPLLDLDVDGRPWRLDTPLGTFEGVPAPVRIRTGDAP
jgi:hypothetical protein